MLSDVIENLQYANIAEKLDEDLLKEIGKSVVQGYEADEQSRSEWKARQEDYLTLASQIVEEKNFPWPGASNVKFPILTESALQFAARANIALFPGFDIVKGKVVGQDPTGQKRERAIRIGKHMSYQLLEQMEDWEDDMDKLLHVIPIVGCAFKKTYYDPIKKSNVSELVLPQDLTVNYWAKSLEAAGRITHIIPMSENEVYEYRKSGVYLDVDLEEVPVSANNETSDKIQGRTNTSTEEDTPFIILEQHTFLDLDNDDYKEPYIVTVHKDSGTVLRIVARYDEEGVIPAAVNDQEVGKIIPTEYFTKYGFIPNPDGGFYDFGFGLYLYGINHTVNTTINQLLDAGTLATTAGGFLGRGARLEGGNQSFKPMEWKTVRSTGDDIRKSIIPLPVREPSPVLFNLLGLMINSAQRLAGTVDSMVGENPGQNQKATTTQLVMAEGLRVFHSIYKRQYRALKKEFKKIYRLNTLFLDPEEYLNILDPKSPEDAQMMAGDYEDKSLDVIPAADPAISNEQQKLMQANNLLQLLPLGLNPQEVKIRVLEAQNQPNIERLLQVPNPGPSLEQLQFQAERQDKDREFQLKVMEFREKAALNKADIIQKLAQAEAAEKGSQLATLTTYMEQLMKEQTSFEAALDKVLQQQQTGEGQNATNQSSAPGMA